jgi:hypothetical protein
VNGAIVTNFAPNPAFNNIYRGVLPCATVGSAGYNPTGCTNTAVFQAVVPESVEALLNARTNPNARVQLAGPLPNPRQSYQDVTTYTLVAGFEGAVPGTDWTWEAFVNHGMARTLSRQTGYYSLNRDDALTKLGQPVDRKLWPFPAHTVNASYREERNQIIVPAGILQTARHFNVPRGRWSSSSAPSARLMRGGPVSISNRPWARMSATFSGSSLLIGLTAFRSPEGRRRCWMVTRGSSALPVLCSNVAGGAATGGLARAASSRAPLARTRPRQRRRAARGRVVRCVRHLRREQAVPSTGRTGSYLVKSLAPAAVE